MNADYLKNVWSSIFRRKGGDGAYTRLFDCLPQSQIEILTSALALEQDELGVIGSVRDSFNWFALTTERIVWLTDGTRSEVQCKDIRDAIVDFQDLKGNYSGKLGLKYITIITFASGEHRLELESGLPLSGVWNILKNIGRRNRTSIHGMI